METETNMHREKTCEDTERMACEDDGRDWSDAPASQGAPKIASKPP